MTHIDRGDLVRHTIYAYSEEDTTDTAIREEGWSWDPISEVIQVVQRADDKPRPGDKVRVEWHDAGPGDGPLRAAESIVERDGYYFGHDAGRKGTATVTVLKRADDPASDPIGTVRKSPYGAVWAKIVPDRWHVFGAPAELNDIDMEGRPVIGACPGTPADTEGQR